MFGVVIATCEKVRALFVRDTSTEMEGVDVILYFLLGA